MEVFVTGASGVIGRRLVPRLLAAKHLVTAIGRTPQQCHVLELLGATPVKVDLFDLDRLRAAVSGHDAVVNLATHMPRSSLRALLPGAWSENDRLRSEGAKNLRAAALDTGVECFVQESFALAYPDHGDAWLEEDVALTPARYNRTLLDAERNARHFAGPRRRSLILRFAAFYGPDSRFLADLLASARRGFAPLPGPASAYLSSVSHDDAAAAVVAALELPTGIYNVADDEPVTHREYLDALAAAFEFPPPALPPPWTAPLFGSPGRLLARSQRISNRKLRAASNWRPRFRSVREGFPALARAQPDHARHDAHSGTNLHVRP